MAKLLKCNKIASVFAEANKRKSIAKKAMFVVDFLEKSTKNLSFEEVVDFYHDLEEKIKKYFGNIADIILFEERGNHHVYEIWGSFFGSDHYVLSLERLYFTRLR